MKSKLGMSLAVGALLLSPKLIAKENYLNLSNKNKDKIGILTDNVSEEVKKRIKVVDFSDDIGYNDPIISNKIMKNLMKTVSVAKNPAKFVNKTEVMSSNSELAEALKAETFAKMTTFKNNYGLGIVQIPTPEKDMFYIGHGGDDLSFTSRNYYNPKSKVLVITLSNHLFDKYCRKIGNEILYEFDKK